MEDRRRTRGKLNFIFSLHDSNRDGSVSLPAPGTMITASLRQNQITVSPDGRYPISSSEFRTLLRRLPVVWKRGRWSKTEAHSQRVARERTSI